MSEHTQKKIDNDDMRELIKAIRKYSNDTKEAKRENGNASITSKDVLFYYLHERAILVERVDKIETTLKMLMWFTGIALTCVSVAIGIIRM